MLTINEDEMETEKTTHARIDLSQHKTIKNAAKAQGVTFQYLLRRVLRVGINVTRLGEKK